MSKRKERVRLTKKEKEQIQKNCIIETYCGLAGSGKTTIAAAETMYSLKKGIKVYSNVPIKGAIEYSCKNIGLVDLSNSLIIIDEAGIEFSSRKFASFPDYALKFFKLFRHYKCRILVLSQANDADKIIRNLSKNIWLVRKRFFGLVASCTYVHATMGVTQDGSDIARIYSVPHPFMQLFERKRYFMPKYWKMFDSWDAPKLPDFEHKVY